MTEPAQTYWMGDLARYTGGVTTDGFHELEIIEGHRAGTLVYTARGPDGQDPYVARNRKEWQESQAQFRRLRELRSN